MKRNQSFEPGVAETVIGHGLHIKGNLECESDLWLDGVVDGNIHAQGNVTLGVNARVKGNISAANATVAGQVEGNVKIEEKLLLEPSAHLLGDIKTAGLTVADGAVLVGNISMPSDPQPTKKLADHQESE